MRTALDRGLADVDLRAQQAAVLLVCSRLRGASPSFLAQLVGTDTAGITGLIDRLESRNLVVRRAHPSDGRAAIVEATRAGRALVPRLTELFEELETHALTGLSREEKSTLVELLARVHDNVQRLIGAPARGGSL
jgi:DNA-binding MarR family transcriptional regulator